MCLPPFISLTPPPLRLMCPVITSPLAIISSLLPLIWSNTLLPLGNCPGFPRRKHFLKKFYFFSLESSWVRGRVCAGLRGFARVCTGLRARMHVPQGWGGAVGKGRKPIPCSTGSRNPETATGAEIESPPLNPQRPPPPQGHQPRQAYFLWGMCMVPSLFFKSDQFLRAPYILNYFLIRESIRDPCV